MSSDFYINKEQAENKGATFWVGQGGGGIADFPDYPYVREFSLGNNGKEIHISCSGKFRSWLTEWLDENNIDYEKV